MKLNPFKEEAKVALLVDGPNLLRKEFSIDLRELKRRAKKYGRIVVAKVFINQFAPEKLIEAIINEGFECVMVLAEKEESDVDVSLAVAAVETIFTKDVDVIALATRDADFLPLIQKAKEAGKVTVLIAVKPGLAASLKHSADHVELL